MEVREAKETDIPQIVSLLKASLGESLLPKTERVWRFKHLENPFGHSLIMLAVKEEKIIGVRAVMRWKWKLKDREFNTYRAVDTGVLPEHQGQGIFRKLNLTAVDVAKRNGNDFIFNTPNSQSLPGNLKMGWKKIQKINLNLVPTNPLYVFSGKKDFTYKVEENCTSDELLALSTAYNERLGKEGKLYTPKSPEYLKWRFEENPLQDYQIYYDKDLYLAGYVKDHKSFNELRITEHMFLDKEGFKLMKRKIKEWNRRFKAPVITFSPQVKFSGLRFSGNFGPVLTLRDLNLDPGLENEFLKLNTWGYSLGDLELF